MGQFRNRINNKMRCTGQKAADVADYLEITELQALKIVGGTKTPTPSQVIQLAQMLALNMAELMEMAKREKIKESNIEITRSYGNAIKEYYGR